MVSNSDKKRAFKEAFSDTMLALVINFPLNFVMIWLAFRFELNEIQTTLFLTVVFTTMAIVRKYFTRLYFHERYLTKLK